MDRLRWWDEAIIAAPSVVGTAAFKRSGGFVVLLLAPHGLAAPFSRTMILAKRNPKHQVKIF